MIDEKTARKLCRKFADLPMAPTTEESVELRVKALASKARSEDHATRVVTSILETKQKTLNGSYASIYPTVADIVQACEYTPDDDQMVSFRRDCPHCGGNGWRSVNGPYGLSAAYPCDHTGAPNARMGVFLPPAVESLYRDNERRGASRRAAAGGSQASPDAVRRVLGRFPPQSGGVR